MKIRNILSIIGLSLAGFVFAQNPDTIYIDLGVSKAIKNHLEFDRKKYINLADGGTNFEGTIKNNTKAKEYYDDLGMNFGRSLGMVFSKTRYDDCYREDVNRPGFADTVSLKNSIDVSVGSGSAAFKNHFKDNLGVAMHDRNGMWPNFIETYFDERAGDGHTMAKTPKAAAELAFYTLKYGYTDWTRPAFYEIMNEPHWAYTSNADFAAIHNEVTNMVHASNLDVKVGGPCSSVAYYYKRNYETVSNFTSFIDKTNCALDFYSFHAYDFLSWSDTKNDFVGRITSGLPLTGVIDAINSYTHKKYGKEVNLLLSEHGGYISSNQDEVLETIANKYFPGSGFNWEMKKRSVSNFNLVSSSIANTMTFMEHPHVILKAVPFMLLESYGWDPKYYSSMLVADNFNNPNKWVESALLDFYKFFAKVEGRRVDNYSFNPDVQQHIFVKENVAYVLLNNQSTSVEKVALKLDNAAPIKKITIRRLGRNVDFTPYFTDNMVYKLDDIELAGRESAVAVIEFEHTVIEKQLVNEVPYYANSYNQTFSGTKNFTVAVPNIDKVESATLRVAIGRLGNGTDYRVSIKVNGTSISVPLADAIGRFNNKDNSGKDEWATTKVIRLDKSLLQESNTISVNFPDGKVGGVGSVIIRASYEGTQAVESVRLEQDSISILKGETSILVPLFMPALSGNKSSTWKSLDEGIATVDATGKVTGIGTGLVNIVVESVDGGFTDTCLVNVEQLKLNSQIVKSGWSVVEADSEASLFGLTKENAIDGNYGTYWRTNYFPKVDPLPHHILVDMGEDKSFSIFEYWPCQDVNVSYGSAGEYELYLTSDTANWGEAVSKGTFDYGFNPDAKSYTTKQSIIFDTPVTGRFFKFVALSEARNNASKPYTTVSEFDVYNNANGINLPDTITIRASQSSDVVPVYLLPNGDILGNTKYVNWESANADVAIVVDGVITGLSIGTTEVTATTLGGDFSASTVVNVIDLHDGVEQIKREELAKVYPNPFSNQAILHLLEPAKGASFQVFSLKGSLLDQGVIENGVLNTVIQPNLSKGIYIIQITNNGSRSAIKIAVN